MKAIGDNFKTSDAAVRAVRAGADVILYPDPVDEAYEAVLAAYEKDPEIQARVDEYVRRILAIKEQYGVIQDNSLSEDMNDINYDSRVNRAIEVCLGNETYIVEREAAEKTVTLVTDRNGIIPLSGSDIENIVVFSPSVTFTDEISQAVNGILLEQGYTPAIFSYTYTNQIYLSDEERSAISNSSLVLLGTSSSNANQRSDE